jgi:hypothetical protein
MAAIGASGVGAASPAGAAGVKPHRITVDPLIHKVNINPNKVTFSCQSNPIDFSNGAPRCYQPSQIQRAYNVTPLLRDGKDGRGRTIVIVDAYDQPYIRTDLNIFNRTFDLKKANFRKVAPQGVPAFDINDPNQVGWAEETTLDVLWAHAIAPGAKIVLVQAKSNQDADILAATQFAIAHHLGDVLSQSFGEAEQCVDPAIARAQHQMFVKAKNQHWTVFASSGDSGAAQPDCTTDGAVLSASTPRLRPVGDGCRRDDAQRGRSDRRLPGRDRVDRGLRLQPAGGRPERRELQRWRLQHPVPEAGLPGRPGAGIGSGCAGRLVQRGRQRRCAHALRRVQRDHRARAERPDVLPLRRHERGDAAVVGHRGDRRPGGTPPDR